MSDALNLRASRRGRWAVALLLLGVVVAFVPALFAGERFVHALPSSFFIGPPGGPAPADEWVECADSPYEWRGIEVVMGGEELIPVLGTAAGELVRSDVGWSAAALTLAVNPLLFAWWRFGAASFGRPAGVLCAAVASISVCALVGRMADRSSVFPRGVWWTVPLGGALMAAAFLVAPTPRVRNE